MAQMLTYILLVLLAALAGAAEDSRVVVLKNSRGAEAHMLPTGACIAKLLVPDRSGELADVLLGLENEDQLRSGLLKSGCIVGRVGGIISGAQFELDGKTYKLEANTDKGRSTLHSGNVGFHRMEWVVEEADLEGPEPWVRLSYTSGDGEQGFPGGLYLQVTYKLTANNELVHDIRATADAPTPLNPFSVPYFNLGGHSSGDVLDHHLTINADYFMPTDAGANPTGKVAAVAGTPLDFRAPLAIGEGLEKQAGVDASAARRRLSGALQLATDAPAAGFRETFALFGLGPDAKQAVQGFTASEQPQLAATLYHPASGRKLEILTNTPAFAIYTGNSLKGKFAGKGGAVYGKHAGVALQTVMFPDAVNQPNFPSTILRPGQQFHTQTVWRFSAA